MSRSVIACSSFSTLVLVPLTYRYVDHAVALAVYGQLRAALGAVPAVNDVLGLVVIAVAVAGVVARRLPAGPPALAELRAAIILAGVVAPLAYLTKTALKFLFGRVETRLWLADYAPDGFNWLSTAEGFNGFPSGHMTICLALAGVGWRYYPRLGWLWLACSLLLPVLLVGGAYHFVSDVIAGAYVAFLVYAASTTPRALAFWRIPPRRSAA